MANNSSSSSIESISDVNINVPPLPSRNEWQLAYNFVNANQTVPTSTSTSSQPSDFKITAALKPYTDYLMIRVPHRGMNDETLVYRFLINPSDINVSKNTEDSQTFTRGGWQFGVWGESFTEITLSGKSAGQYFHGLDGVYKQYSLSYRNLMQAALIFNNNGYFFEGEGFSTNYSIRRRIKLHQDIELWCGNFIWYGMFKSFSLTQDAENPFGIGYSLTFTAWKERYKPSSPYINSAGTNVERGHSYGAYSQYVGPATPVATSGAATSSYGPTSAILSTGTSSEFGDSSVPVPFVPTSASQLSIPFVSSPISSGGGNSSAS